MGDNIALAFIPQTFQSGATISGILSRHFLSRAVYMGLLITASHLNLEDTNVTEARIKNILNC